MRNPDLASHFELAILHNAHVEVPIVACADLDFQIGVRGNRLNSVDVGRGVFLTRLRKRRVQARYALARGRIWNDSIELGRRKLTILQPDASPMPVTPKSQLAAALYRDGEGQSIAYMRADPYVGRMGVNQRLVLVLLTWAK